MVRRACTASTFEDTVLTLLSSVERSTATSEFEAAVIRPCASMVITGTFETVPILPPYKPAVTVVSSRSKVTALADTVDVSPESPKNVRVSEPRVTVSSAALSPRIVSSEVRPATLS